MSADDILKHFGELPADKQAQVTDLIKLLREQVARTPNVGARLEGYLQMVVAEYRKLVFTSNAEAESVTQSDILVTRSMEYSPAQRCGWLD